MATLTSITAYCTTAQADTILGLDAPWISSLVADKANALMQGKIYIDRFYKCDIDLTNIPVNVTEANALLANEHLIQSLFERQDNNGPISETSVKAGSVTSSKKYAVSQSGTIGRWLDPFTYITSLLMQGAVCRLAITSIGTARILRN